MAKLQQPALKKPFPKKEPPRTKPLSWLLVALWAILSVGFAVAFYELIARVVESPDRLLAVLGGMLAYVLVWALFLRGRNRFWRTFEHELTHVIFALLSFQRVKHFRASAHKGGSIHHLGPRGNFVISLAPYFFPTVSLLPLLLLFIVTPAAEPYIQFIVGFTLMYHVINPFEEARPYQTDLTNHGLVFSYAFIVLMNLVCLGTALAISGFGGRAGWDYLMRGFEVLYLWI